jgi:CHRD domain
MQALNRFARNVFRVALVAATALFVGHSASALSDEVKVMLSGAQEIPPVSTAASGVGMVQVGADKSIRGEVTPTGVQATMAHIHLAPAGKNGPIIIPLVKTSDNVWSVPAGAKLTDDQYSAYKAGDLYFNVHSAAHKPGEIRGQIKP